MYLWKYWRETRILFGAALLGIAVLFALTLKSHSTGHPPFEMVATIIRITLSLPLFPLSLIAWGFGSFGVGRDLGEKSGSFLFTRPVSHAFFIWRDWGLGMALLLPVTVLLNLVLWLQIHRILAAAGDSLHGSILLSGRPVSVAFLIGLNCAAAYLLAALVFGLTYFSAVLVKHSRGLILGAGVLVGYLILRGIAGHYFALHLPDLKVPIFALSGQMATGLADHLVFSLAIRTLIVLLFPLAAQLVLEKADL